MIEIIVAPVKMPQSKDRRFQFNVENDKWWVIDTENENKIVYKGKYKEVMIAVHNLNKKHYRDNG